MKWRTKLSLFYFVMFTLGMVFTYVNHLDKVIPYYLVALVISVIIGLLVSYIVGILHSQQLELIAHKASKIAFHDDSLMIDKHNELDSLARALDHLASDLKNGEDYRNQMIADVAHELRTPLTILRGQLEMIIEGVTDFRKEQLLPVLDELSRMSKLINDLQQLSLAEAGRIKLDRRWYDFNPLIEEIVHVLGSVAEEKEITLISHGRAGREVYCDQARIKQVLINLIGNAIRYSPEGSKVKISVLQLEAELRVDVFDNGPGIPPEHVPYLFKRFYRIEGSRNRELGGTGLGLAIAKEFVEAHGGALSVTSKLGSGSTFTIILPAFPES